MSKMAHSNEETMAIIAAMPIPDESKMQRFMATHQGQVEIIVEGLVQMAKDVQRVATSHPTELAKHRESLNLIKAIMRDITEAVHGKH